MRYGGEAENTPVVDASKSTRNTAHEDCCSNLEDGTVRLRHGSKHKLHQTKQNAKGKDNGHVNPAGLEEDGHGCTREAVHDDAEPDGMAILCVNHLVQPGEGVVQAYDVMQDLFVNVVGVFELAEVDALCSAHNLDLGRVGQDVVKADDHTARDVEKLAVDLEDFCCHGKVFLKTMRGRPK